MCRLVVAHIVKDVKLQLGSPVANLRNPSSPYIGLCLLSDIAWVTTVVLTRNGIQYVADQIQRGDIKDRIETSSLSVSDQQHVTFINLLKSANTRAVDTDAFVKQLVFEAFNSDRAL